MHGQNHIKFKGDL